MNFTFTEEQTLLAESLQRFVQDHYDLDQRETVVKKEPGYTEEHWQTFAELGWLALPFSEDDGGIGGNELDTMLVMEEFGKGGKMDLEGFKEFMITIFGVSANKEDIFDGFDLIKRGDANISEEKLDIAGMDGEMQFEGRDSILSLMTDSMEEQTDQRRHVVSNSFFADAGGDAVSVVSNITITSVENGAARLVTTGLYRDTVRREAGEWRIAARRIELDMAY